VATPEVAEAIAAQTPDMRSIQRSEVGFAHSTNVGFAHSAEVASTDSSGVTSSAPARLGARRHGGSGERPSEKSDHQSFQHCLDSLV